MTTVISEVQVTYVRQHFLIRFDGASLYSWSLATMLRLKILHFLFSGIFLLLSLECDLVCGRGVNHGIPEPHHRIWCAGCTC